MKPIQVTESVRCSNRKKKKLKNDVWRRDAYSGWVRCYWCRKKLSKDEFTLEHIQPLSLGGTDALSNLAAACADCNHEYGRLTQTVMENLKKCA